MRRNLSLHPDSTSAAVTAIEVEAVRSSSGQLSLTYWLRGGRDGLYWPPATQAERTDQLWKRTCFEAFVRPADGQAYLELNLAPSTRWAAYRFSGYRAGMEVAGDVPAPRIGVEGDPASWALRAEIDLGQALPGEGPWRLGLCAVIEEADGRLSYWALAHPRGQPDFHHSATLTWNL
jgi:hypothetical protein